MNFASKISQLLFIAYKHDPTETCYAHVTYILHGYHYTAYLQLSELWFCAGLNPACDISEILDGEDLWQRSWLEIRRRAFRRTAIPQKQLINIIFCIFVSVSASRSFYMYLSELSIIIFIFITINHMISLKQAHFLFGHFSQKVSYKIGAYRKA